MCFLKIKEREKVKERNKENRKTYLITLIVLAAFVLLLIGGAFAYFLATVTNNTTPVSVTSQVANLTEIFNLCSLSDSGICANTYPWVYNTSYWSGSAREAPLAWNVSYDGGVQNVPVYDDNYYGARPIIQILASAL